MEEDREVFLEEGEEEEEKKLKKWRETEGQNWNCNRLVDCRIHRFYHHYHF